MYNLRIVCSAYLPSREMVQSYLLAFYRQTRKDDIKLTIYHDGPGGDTSTYVNDMMYLFPPGQVEYLETETRLHNEQTREGWGHPQKDLAIQTTTEKYIKFDNLDNYMVPRQLEIALNYIESLDLDFGYWDIVHNYENVNPEGGPAYSVLRAIPRLNGIDVCEFIIKTDLAKKTRWLDFSTGGDGIFVQRALETPGVTIGKIPGILGVHN